MQSTGVNNVLEIIFRYTEVLSREMKNTDEILGIRSEHAILRICPMHSTIDTFLSSVHFNYSDPKLYETVTCSPTN
jgi:hypothetical protein